MMTADELLLEWRARLINERDCIIGLVRLGRDNDKTRAKLKDRTDLILNIDTVLEQRNVSVDRFRKERAGTQADNNG